MRHTQRLRTIPLLGAAIAAIVLYAIVPSVFESVAAPKTPEAILRSADPALEAVPPLMITGATAAERAVTKWAVGRFESAGLTLPNVTVNFRGDNDCGGAAGAYRHSAAAVTMCNRGGHDNPPRQTLLHELAHAWSLHTMHQGDITTFLSSQGLSHWTSDEVGYWSRGAERVAEYVAWGLQDSRDEDRSIWTYGKDCTDLATAFRLTTGSGPLNGSPSYCTAS